MFLKEGYQWAGSILAFLAVLLVPIPFILGKYGRALRLRSPWARQHMDDIDDHEKDNFGEGNKADEQVLSGRKEVSTGAVQRADEKV